MSTFMNDVAAIIANNPDSTEAIKDVISLVDQHILSIAAKASKVTQGTKLAAVDDAYNQLTGPYDDDPEASAALNRLTTSIIMAVMGHPNDRPGHLAAVTDTLNSLRHRPELCNTAREAGKLVLDAITENL